jgi:very-short-patch-repair endonuclease
MMSPLAVAQYVPKGSIHFDLCIVDEASQMPPESAIGALARCSQAVVVGDTNQLPPSSFFKTLIDDEEADEDETVLNESILEMANGTFRPARRLRWHYRSRHSGLIRFSNRLVYRDDLIVFPSATESMSRMGVELRQVAGRYKAGTNPIEAKAVVEAAYEFMRTDPNRSLGIVTLNQKQQDLIREEFEYALSSNHYALEYIESWKERNDGLEEFFIKNLENVQGDERDVIFIGTVYGPEEPGARVMQRFGPINGVAGKRRLNVLFTRAKQKIVTFSSMTAADITADEHGNAGAYLLRRWLEYSATGVLESGEQTEREPDSDFELFVMNQIKAMGCEPVPQVGVAGYFVDIGVRHSEWPYGFVLGVECDGASYHSAKSARDRDRLRQEVLEGLGWRLHRIWSTDWFNNPAREAERLRAITCSRLKELKRREFEYSMSPPGEPKRAEPRLAVAREAVILPLFKDESILPLFKDEKPSELKPAAVQIMGGTQQDGGIAVGDTVRVKYLTDDRKTVQITISKKKSDPSLGVVHHETPIARALLGAEVGDEVEVLVGSYVKPAVVEHIIKGAVGA